MDSVIPLLRRKASAISTQANASSFDRQKVDRSLISLASIYNRRLDATS